jgi:Ca2+-binding RTX toxin-like protein
MHVYLGDGNDRYVAATPPTAQLPVYVHGGGGDDAITGPSGAFGDDGNDVLGGSSWQSGGAGADRLVGTSGSDTLDPGTGADDVTGGAGIDGVDWMHRDDGVSVTLDDVADDGAPGEGANIHADVENVTTGNGDDTIAGSAASNTLSGGSGVNAITGGDGKDVISGAAEGDGGPGNDTIFGAYGVVVPDVHLVGGPGRDVLSSGAGNDTIDLRDGEADADGECGGGTDTAIVDVLDANVLIGCETVAT